MVIDSVPGIKIGLVLLSAVAFLSGNAAEIVTVPKRFFGLGEIRGVAVSHDLRFLATSGQAGAFIWDMEKSTLLHRLESEWAVSAIAFSPTTNLLLTASGEHVFGWNAETGARVGEFSGHVGNVEYVSFSRDGQMFVSASADNSARVWSVERGAELLPVWTPGSPILKAEFSPDGKKLATIDTFLTNCVKIWDVETQKQLGALPKTNWTANECLFTPDGQLLTAAPDRSVLLWDVHTFQQVRSFQGITAATAIVIDLWLPNENTLAAASSDGSVYLWNLETAELLQVVPGEPVVAAAGVPSDFLTVAAHIDYNVRVRQLPGGDTLRTFVGHTTSSHSAVAFSPDGGYVLSGGTEPATRLWERGTGKLIRTFVGFGAGTAAAMFSPDGARILTTVGLPNPGVRLWNVETGEIEREFRWTGSWPGGATISSDGLKIAAGSQDERVRIFDTSTGELLRTILSTGWVTHVAFSPVAPLLAVGAGIGEYTASIINHETGEPLESFTANAGPVTALTFSPNGETLLVGWQDGLVRLYNSTNYQMEGEFLTSTGFLDAAMFSPDGQYILTGESFPGFAGNLRDAQTFELIRSFSGHKWTLSALAFDAEGTSILTGAEVVREWSISDLVAGLSIERVSGQLRLTWRRGELEHAGAINGPWLSVTNASSPLVVSSAESAAFYRLRVE